MAWGIVYASAKNGIAQEVNSRTAEALQMVLGGVATSQLVRTETKVVGGGNSDPVRVEIHYVNDLEDPDMRHNVDANILPHFGLFEVFVFYIHDKDCWARTEPGTYKSLA